VLKVNVASNEIFMWKQVTDFHTIGFEFLFQYMQALPSRSHQATLFAQFQRSSGLAQRYQDNLGVGHGDPNPNLSLKPVYMHKSR